MVPSVRRVAPVTTVNIVAGGPSAPPIETMGSASTDQRSAPAGAPELTAIAIPAESRAWWDRGGGSGSASQPAAAPRHAWVAPARFRVKRCTRTPRHSITLPLAVPVRVAAASHFASLRTAVTSKTSPCFCRWRSLSHTITSSFFSSGSSERTSKT